MSCEDGTGIPGADCYVEQAYVSDYLASTGRDIAWSAATDAERDLAIVRASAWIDMTYGLRFAGLKKTQEQGMEWPRAFAYDRNGYELDGLPVLLTRAVAEMCARAIEDPTSMSPETPAGGNVASETTTVGPISTSKTYIGGKDAEKRYTVVDRLLRQGGLIENGNWASR